LDVVHINSIQHYRDEIPENWKVTKTTEIEIVMKPSDSNVENKLSVDRYAEMEQTLQDTISAPSMRY
jgi:hypothetical protein